MRSEAFTAEWRKCTAADLKVYPGPASDGRRGGRSGGLKLPRRAVSKQWRGTSMGNPGRSVGIIPVGLNATAKELAKKQDGACQRGREGRPHDQDIGIRPPVRG